MRAARGWKFISERTAEGWSIRYRNDGDAPSGPIVEGSGLTALRARTEAAGGAMDNRPCTAL